MFLKYTEFIIFSLSTHDKMLDDFSLMNGNWGRMQ